MNVLPETLDLVGVAEIADMAGASKNSVSNWKKTHENFPKPVANLRSGPVFWKSQVEEWLLQRLSNPKIAPYVRQKDHPSQEGKIGTPVPPKPLTPPKPRAPRKSVKRAPKPAQVIMTPPPQFKPPAAPFSYAKQFQPGRIITDDDL